MTVETTSAAPAASTTTAPADTTKSVETVVTEAPKVAETAAPKDPKAIHAEQERRLEARATALRADLAKRESAVKAQAAELAKRETELKELSSLKEAKASAKDDPISFLEAFGLTFEDVAKAAASGAGSDPVSRKALKEAREAKAALEAREKADAEKEKQGTAARAEAQKQETLKNIDGMLKSDKKYRFAAEFGSADDVFNAWFAAYQQTGKMPDVHKVAAKVNEYYKAQAERAHKTWAEENPVQPDDKKIAAPAADDKKIAAPPADKKVVAEEKPRGIRETKKIEEKEELRGRSRGARTYASEIAQQLEEARKSRGA